MAGRRHHDPWAAVAIAMVAVALAVLVLSLRTPRRGDVAARSQPSEALVSAGATSSAPGAGPASDRARNKRPSSPALAGVVEMDEAALARCQADERDQFAAAARAIDARASPDAAIRRAWLLQLGRGLTSQARATAAGELLAASARWPRDVGIAWAALESCSGDAACMAAWRHVRELDGGNAETWIWAMGKADPGSAEWASALHRAATAPGYDPGTGLVYLHLFPALERLPIPAACRGQRPDTGSLRRHSAFLRTMALEAMRLPSYAGLAICADVARYDPSRGDCVDLLSRVAVGDTVLEQGIGLSLLFRILGPDGASPGLRERYRQYLWLQTAIAGHPGYGDYALSHVWQQGEVQAMQDYARSQGLGSPPQDWLPDNPEARARVLGVATPGNH